MENSGASPTFMDLQNSACSAKAKEFLAITNTRELSAFLGVSHSLYTFLLYRKPPGSRYKTFTIKKKNGEPRLIESPIRPIRRMQRVVADVLTELHSPRKCVHGFVPARSIVSNAAEHQRRRWVLNFDLRDFFHSIHFGRVAGLFAGWRYKFSREVSIALAHLCCHERRLPQGAPTSPILSNIVCDRLDAELTSYARRNGSRYTRYCDDISISTTRTDCPTGLATLQDKRRPLLSESLVEILQRNHFVVNPDKTRVHHRSRQQEVTGLTANTKPNVPREYVRQIRAMLHAWTAHGLEKAEAEYRAKWDKKDRRPSKHLPRFKHIVRGKIEFVGAVRGKEDPIYVRFLRQYCHLDPNAKSKVLAMIDATRRDVFLCHASEDKNAVVTPLANALESANISYFLDSKEICWGDSVTHVINQALVVTRFVIVVISADSLKKHWPQKEMNAALAREISDGETRVLPLLVAANKNAREALWKQLALQSDKRYLEWEGDTTIIVDELQKLIARPGTK